MGGPPSVMCGARCHLQCPQCHLVSPQCHPQALGTWCHPQAGAAVLCVTGGSRVTCERSAQPRVTCVPVAHSVTCAPMCHLQMCPRVTQSLRSLCHPRCPCCPQGFPWSSGCPRCPHPGDVSAAGAAGTGRPQPPWWPGARPPPRPASPLGTGGHRGDKDVTGTMSFRPSPVLGTGTPQIWGVLPITGPLWVWRLLLDFGDPPVPPISSQFAPSSLPASPQFLPVSPVPPSPFHFLPVHP